MVFQEALSAEANLQFGYVYFEHSNVQGYAFVPFPNDAGSPNSTSILGRPFYVKARAVPSMPPFSEKWLFDERFLVLGYLQTGRAERQIVPDSEYLRYVTALTGLKPPSTCPSLPVVEIPRALITKLIPPRLIVESDSTVSWAVDYLGYIQDKFPANCAYYVTGSSLLTEEPPTHDFDVVVETSNPMGIMKSLDEQASVFEYGRSWSNRFLGYNETIVCPFFRAQRSQTAQRLSVSEASGRRITCVVEVIDDTQTLYVPSKVICNSPEFGQLTVVLHNTLGAGLLRRGRAYSLKGCLLQRGKQSDYLHIFDPTTQVQQV
jgi:hypothetical protein